MSAFLILITNDDGIGAEGLAILEESLRPLGTVWVVAPDREQSGQGHALTLHHPLRFEKRGSHRFAVQGTPTDCIYLGINQIMPERPRIVVSGINKGTNLGDDVTYSGTVAAAFEATLISVPAFAISQEPGEGGCDFGAAGRFVYSLAGQILTRGLPPDTLLNVNVPNRMPRGVRITRQGKRMYSGEVIERSDPKGRPYYWIGGTPEQWEGDESSDFSVLAEGHISVSPLHLDLTNYGVMDEVKRWNLTP
ncbi:MAG: 5'/3'-nucleotidase SurE [Acidobacteria bacterium]|nr:5'/3'-nucleotidase SurE [Acidobacteriota bacterium]